MAEKHFDLAGKLARMTLKWAKFQFLQLQRGLRGSTHKKVGRPKLHNMSHLDEVFIIEKCFSAMI